MKTRLSEYCPAVTKTSSASRNGEVELLVQEKGCFADCAVQVIVKRGWRTEQIAWKSDCVINFAHADWAGNIVAVFVDGGYCGQIKAAYDTSSRRAVDFRSTERRLSNSIIKAYRVTPQELQTDTAMFSRGPLTRAMAIHAAVWTSFGGDILGRNSSWVVQGQLAT